MLSLRMFVLLVALTLVSLSVDSTLGNRQRRWIQNMGISYRDVRDLEDDSDSDSELTRRAVGGGQQGQRVRQEFPEFPGDDVDQVGAGGIDSGLQGSNGQQGSNGYEQGSNGQQGSNGYEQGSNGQQGSNGYGQQGGTGYPESPKGTPIGGSQSEGAQDIPWYKKAYNHASGYFGKLKEKLRLARDDYYY